MFAHAANDPYDPISKYSKRNWGTYRDASPNIAGMAFDKSIGVSLGLPSCLSCGQKS
jgi:hypothetical protein